ncbi:MAG TPA: LysR family transcriptional regulator [Burkholderiales bacterium]|nr:LysR family transcriptional regulator [Burkholderiales bacterium]
MSRSHPPDLATLALFGRIAETRTITKAAAQPHLALAAASRRIAGLESRLGVKLLERSACGVDEAFAIPRRRMHASTPRRKRMIRTNQWF